MNLIEQFNTLDIPDYLGGTVFTAAPIPEYPDFRVAIDGEANPVLLLSVVNPVKNLALKNFRLKYLQLAQNVECKVSEIGKTSFQTFTVITFTNPDRNLQEYFLRISETLVKSLNAKPTQEQVVETLNRFVEVFRALSDTPTNTVQGIWAELFLIDISTNPKAMLNYWHNIPEEKFDFNSGAEKIEIKSSGNFERIHTFSSEQLNPPESTQVIIGSIFIRPSSKGRNIQNLVDSITAKVKDDLDLVDKLNSIVIRTLGSSLEQSIKMKFDFQIASDSFRFYRHQDIHKIEEISIPNEVTEVRYKSDLITVTPFDIIKMKNKGELFNSI